MTDKEFKSRIKFYFIEGEINHIFTEINHYFGNLNSYQNRKLLPIVNHKYSIESVYEQKLISKEEFEKNKSKIDLKLDSVLEDLILEKKNNGKDNLNEVLKNIEKIRDSFAANKNERFQIFSIFLDKTFSSYKEDAQKLIKEGSQLQIEDFKNYADYVLKQNQNSIEILNLIGRIEREKRIIYSGEKGKIDKPEIYESIYKDELKKVLLDLIKGGKFLEEKTDEEWNNIELLIELRRLEKEKRLGIIQPSDYRKRRNNICIKLINLN